MVIDSHLHIGLMGTTESGLIRYLDENGIDKCWLLTWEEEKPPVPMLYQPLDLEEVLTAWKNHPDRIIPFYAPDPGRKGWKEDLERCLDMGFAGCGELKVARNWDDPVILELLAFLNVRKLPLVFHSEQPRTIYEPRGNSILEPVLRRIVNERFNGAGAYYTEKMYRKGLMKKHFSDRLRQVQGYLDNLDALENALVNFPEVKFVAHGPHFWNNFGVRKREYHFHEGGKVEAKGKIWSLLQKHPNLYCDISGHSGWNALQRDPVLSREFFTGFSGHILFGTDNFSFKQKEYLEGLSISNEAKEAILAGNAMSMI